MRESSDNGHYADASISKDCPFCSKTGSLLIPQEFLRFGEPQLLRSDGCISLFKLVSAKDEYVVKQILCGDSAEKAWAAEHEIQILKLLRNVRGVMQLADWRMQNVDGTRICFLLMECCTPLIDWIKEKPVSKNEVIGLGIRLCRIFADIRDRGILHLDIQPDNLYFRQTGDEAECVVGGFASALQMGELRGAGCNHGTSAYIAPEAALGRYSERSEVYALGRTLRFLLESGRPPRSEPFPAEKAVPDDLGSDALNADGNSSIRALLLCLDTACATVPEHRFPTFERFAAALEQAEHGFRYGEVGEEPRPVKQVQAAPSAAMMTYYAEAEKPKRASSPGLLRRLFHRGDPSAKKYERKKPQAPIPKYPAASSAVSGFGPAEIAAAAAPDLFPGPQFSDSIAAPAAAQAEEAANPLPISDVQFSAVSQRETARGDDLQIDIFMYEDECRDVIDQYIADSPDEMIEKRGGYQEVVRGARVKVSLTAKKIDYEDELELRWRGGYLDFSFLAAIPEDYPGSQIPFTANVFTEGVLLCRLNLVVSVAGGRSAATVERQDVRSAFISYASQDRDHVASIVFGMKKARPDLDIFFDIEYLSSGDRWEEILKREIRNRDLLYLCWSRNAQRSEWVDREWRYAYETKGPDGVEPIPLEGPELCAPPRELSDKHFNDVLLLVMAGEKSRIRQHRIMQLRTGASWIIGDEMLSIGRNPGNSIVLKGDQVSREHCFLSRVNADQLLLEDRSTNGTILIYAGRKELLRNEMKRLEQTPFALQIGEEQFLVS